MKTSIKKAKIRNTEGWKQLRETVFEKQKGICPFCGSKLFKGYNIHHKDDRLEHYADFSNPDMYVALHRDCHRMIEALHRKRNLPLKLKSIIDKYFSTY